MQSNSQYESYPRKQTVNVMTPWISSYVQFEWINRHRTRLIEYAVRWTHVLIGGLVERDQVGVEAGQTHHWPQGEETHQHLQHSKLQLRKQQHMFSAWHAVAEQTVDSRWRQNGGQLHNMIEAVIVQKKNQMYQSLSFFFKKSKQAS